MLAAIGSSGAGLAFTREDGVNRTDAQRSAVAKAFRMEEAPSAVTRVLQKSATSITELRCDSRNFGITKSIPREDAYLVALQLRPCQDHDLYFDGRLTQPKNFGAGVTSIYDLRTDPVAELRDPFHSLMFHLPRKALKAVAQDAGVSSEIDLRHRPGVSTEDSVVLHLLCALLPAMEKPAEIHPLFLEHIALALTVHVASVYGGIKPGAGMQRGGLTSWQEKRAKELMTATLGKEISMDRLAAECGLSARHFARAFRQSTGVPPHRWLLKYRIDRAKDVLMHRGMSLAETAIACGFADQSHFTRVFTAMVGVSPGAWRRRNEKT